MATANRISGLIIQAMRYLGQRHVDRAVIEKLQKRLGLKERAKLLKDVSLAPAWIGEWIGELMRQIASGTTR